MKDKNFWKASGYSKKDLNELIKSIWDQNVAYKQKKNDYKIAMTIIEGKWEKAIADYIRRCNTSEKYVKKIWKVAK